MKTVNAIVVYPVCVRIDVDDNLQENKIEDIVFSEAEKILETTLIKPVIHELNIEE